MNIHADKTTETKSNAVANGMVVQQGVEHKNFQLEDNRPEAVVQRKIKETANNSKQVKHLKTVKVLANRSPQVKELRAVQVIADDGSYNTNQLKEIKNSTTTHSSELVSISTVPEIRSESIQRTIQCEFAVEISVARQARDTPRKIKEVRFGERPNTQFGKSQQDHIVAWTIKKEEVRSALMRADNLHDAASLLLMLMDDTNALLEDTNIDDAIDEFSGAVMHSSDDLDLQQAIQSAARNYLEAYNLNENVTRKRVGISDKTEGARVKKAKNEIVDEFSDLDAIDFKQEHIDDFALALSNTFHLDQQTADVDKNGYDDLIIAIGNALISGFNLISGSELFKHANEITVKFLRLQLTHFGLTGQHGKEVLKRLKNNARFAAFLN